MFLLRNVFAAFVASTAELASSIRLTDIDNSKVPLNRLFEIKDFVFFLDQRWRPPEKRRADKARRVPEK